MIYTCFTDGSSRGNPGNAAWSLIVMTEEKVKEFGGFFEKATNNQMELLGVMNALNFALSKLDKEDEIVIYSDSQYVTKSCNEWLSNWQKNNWKNSSKKEVLNKDMWVKTLALLNSLSDKGINVLIKHVKGHNGQIFNERADKICTSIATKEEITFLSGKKSDYLKIISN